MKKLLVLFTIFLLVALAGCQTQESAEPRTGKAFIGGNEGLRIGFLTGAPPDSVFDTDNPFSISLKVENVGEYDIENTADATVEITGISAADFGVDRSDLKKNVEEELDKASLDSAGNTIQGTTTVVDFEDLEYQGTVSGTVQFPLVANICYEYGTKAQAKLCILEDLLGKTGGVQLCDPNNQNLAVESSGAPLKIISMSQNVLGSNKISFIIKIRNEGDGSLHQKGTECDNSIPARDKVWVEVADTGLGDLACSGLKDGDDTSGYITLYNGEASLRCTQTIDEPTDFETVAEVSITYGYREAVQKMINVKQAS